MSLFLLAYTLSPILAVVAFQIVDASGWVWSTLADLIPSNRDIANHLWRHVLYSATFCISYYGLRKFETNDLYVGNFASALKITDATISAAPTNGNVTIAPDGTGELRVDAETEIHSSKGLIIHNGAQGDYLDLTGAGSDYGPIYGTGVAVESFGAAPTLTMFAHKANGAGK